VDEIVLVIMGHDPVAQAACLKRLAGAMTASGAVDITRTAGLT
jgi:hypothetical protein